MKNQLSRKKRVVVLTTRGDAHLPYVQQHLDQPLVVIDPQELLKKKTLSFIVRGHELVVVHDDLVLGGNVAGVWFRKPQNIKSENVPTREEFKEYVLKALEQQHMMIYGAFPKAVWISNYHAIQRASNKAFQLARARQLGFAVPDTLFTSDSSSAYAFIKKHRETIMKTVPHFYTAVDGKYKVMYATRLDKQKLPNLNNLYFSPAIFQQAVEIAYDMRVTVVGNQVFPAIIKNSGLDQASPIRDWRIGHFEGQMHIEPHDTFPKEIRELCIQYIRSFDLMYGAIDLVVDTKGKYWFLENNPAGQWGFVERLTGQPISKAVAELLMGH